MNKKLIIVVFYSFILCCSAQKNKDRELWLNEMLKIANPVLKALSNDELKVKMPVEQSNFDYGDRKPYAHLEAFGRLMAGVAPWLELGVDTTDEGKQRAKYIELTHNAIFNAVNPTSKDYMNFNEEGKQPMVDAAFLAQAFLRAPKQLWENLPSKTKPFVINAFKKALTINAIPYNNWLLFAGIIEAFLVKNANYQGYSRIEFAIRKHMEWYTGDGIYADGERFHWDYYNSYVIHPMLIDVVSVLAEMKHPMGKYQKVIIERAQRYAEILERQISPEGTYPIIGRSSIYRFGAFQVLSQMALLNALPKRLSNGQVRAALTAVLKRLHQAKGTYDTNGWLQIGVVGHQPKMAEPYICTGSLYLTALGFLPLGLPESHPFWSSKPKPWTMVNIWGGNPNVKRDQYKN